MAKVDPHWIRTRADERAVREGCTFDLDAALYVREFLENFCRQSIGEWEGEPLTLLQWQWEDVVAPLYGWKRPDGRRRFRSGYVQVAKKNGKSTLISGLGLYHLTADGESVPECYICACDRKQASIVYNEASRMRKASPLLSARLDDVPSDKRIVNPRNSGKLEALSNVVETKDGFNASFTVFDELHRQKTDRLWKIMRYAGKSRRQPLRLAITTAGTTEDVERKSICYQQYEYSKSILDGTNDDPLHLAVIYEPAEGEASDLDDPAIWYAANPSLGKTIDLDGFKGDLEEAKKVPTQLEEFKQLCLNIWVSNRKRFLPKAQWDLCGQVAFTDEDLEGFPCYGGLDLANTTDLAAWALVFLVEDTLLARLRFWCPEEGASRRERVDRVPYRTWAREGHITLTEGNVIDYDVIREAINADYQRFHFKVANADPWNALQLLLKLRDVDGLPVQEIRQGFKSLSAPTKELERLVASAKFQHGNNPVLNWMAGNAVAKKDGNGNVILSKDRSAEKIDGLPAVVNAVAALLVDQDDGDSGPSIYEERGIEFF